MDLSVVVPSVYAALVAASLALRWWRAPGFKVEGKHVFITGGSDGLGLEVAKRYAAAGAKVSIVARRLGKLEEAKKELEGVYRKQRGQSSTPPPVFIQSCDVTDFTAVQRAVDAANAFHGHVTDHLICNAGISNPGYFLDQDVEVHRRVMDINYFGALHTVRAALPAMIREPTPGRQVVFVGSGFLLIACISAASYCSSKYALRGLAEALRNELKLYDIHVSTFYAGNIDTELYRSERSLMSPECTLIEGTSAPLSSEKVAQQLVNGIASGDFAITNDPMIFVLRVIANGVVPRFNSPLELLLLPLFMPIQVAFLAYMDAVVWWSRRTREQKSKAD